MAKNQKRKDEIRAYAATHNLSYTSAMRAVDADEAVTIESWALPTIHADLFKLIVSAPSRYGIRVETAAATHLAMLLHASELMGGADLDDGSRGFTRDFGADTVALSHTIAVYDDEGSILSELTLTTTGAPRSRTMKTTVEAFGIGVDRAFDALTAGPSAEQVADAAAQLAAAVKTHGSHNAGVYREILWMREHNLELNSTPQCLCDYGDWNGRLHEHGSRSDCRIPRNRIFEHLRQYTSAGPGPKRPVALSWASYSTGLEKLHGSEIREFAASHGLDCRIGNPADSLYGAGTPILMWSADAAYL